MIIKKLELENIGPFFGQVTFDLETKNKRNGEVKPLILFGGKNGAGKTNILDSIKLGLYGKRIFNRKVTEAGYKEAVAERIHKGDGVIEASIVIHMDVIHHGLPHELRVERRWKKKGDGVNEELWIEEDGEVLTRIRSDHWQDYIDELLSPNLAHLFFFDGEKIEELASDDENQASRALSDAVQSLFGLNLIKQLESDLQILEKQVGERGGSDAEKEIATLHDMLTEKKAERKEIDQKWSKCIDNINREKTKQLKTEEELRKRGGDYANKREELQGKAESSRTELKNIETQFYKECDELLPFLFCRELVKDLKEDLHAYDEAETDRRAAKVLEEKAEKIKKAFQATSLKKADSSLNSKQTQSLKSYIEGILSDFSSDQVDIDTRDIDLSQGDFISLSATCEAVETKARKDIKEFELSLRNASNDYQSAETELEKAPKQDDLRNYFDELRIISERLGTFQGEEKQIEDKHKSISKEISDLERKLKKIADAFVDESESALILKRSTAARTVAEKYTKELSKKKMADLSATVLEIFNSLARKKEMLQNVIIDPETFSVNVVHSKFGIIPKERLSAGERQMLAVSILWALMKLSGKVLPIVIDTPLGRLDTDHRDSMVLNYLVNASHQVIVLSTDSEITENYYKKIKPNLSHEYLLQYNAKKGVTSAENGYFWS